MPRKLTTATVAKRLKAQGLSASPEELQQLTRMMNEDLARESERSKQSKAVDQFFAEFWKPVRKEKR